MILADDSIANIDTGTCPKQHAEIPRMRYHKVDFLRIAYRSINLALNLSPSIGFTPEISSNELHVTTWRNNYSLVFPFLNARKSWHALQRAMVFPTVGTASISGCWTLRPNASRILQEH